MSQPQDMSKYTAASTWGTTAKDAEKDLTLPSGAVCRVRKPGMDKVMMSGIIDMIDTLGIDTDNLVNATNRRERRMAAQKGQATTQDAQENVNANFLKRMAKDSVVFEGMMKMVDKVTAMTVIIPEVHLLPQKPNPAFDPQQEEGLRNPRYVDDPSSKVDGLIYVDSVDFEDKFAIMDFGMGDVEKMRQFRDADDAVGDAQSLDRDAHETVDSVGDRL